MAIVEAPPSPAAAERLDRLERIWQGRPGILGWLTTTDHKRIGLLYFWTTLVLFAAGGAEALIIRTQLATPDADVVSPSTFDELFTLHGITMIFFFVIPMTTGAFGNYLIPLMIGARDMAFPRLNALGYWIFLASGIFMYTSLGLGMSPNAGWFDYVPLASREFAPGRNVDFYCLGIIFNSLSSTLTAALFIVTILKSRAPGMSLNRIPLFCYAMLAAAFGLLFALPPLSADTIFLFLDRNVGTHVFDVAHGGTALLWQHLFWIFGHPEVYILIVPAFGIATSIIPAFTQRKLVAYPLVAIAELLVVFIGFGVWAHHMFATGLPTVSLVFFAGATAMVVIPSTIQVFAWCMSFVTGTPRFTTPLLFIAGFIFMFATGGLTGIMFMAIPFDQQVTDTYFVVAHFHYIIFGAAVFPIFAGIYYWFPKVTGKLPFDRIGQLSFWVLFVGTNLLFFPMHVVGLLGMTRRVYTYPPNLGWDAYNLAETVGGYVTAAGILLLLGNLVYSYLRGQEAGPDPWHGPTLEWTTSSPPPDYNFPVVPKVTSAYPSWDDADRAEDRRKLDEGVLVLGQGHEQVASSPVDAGFAEAVDMPHESPWPPVLAASLALVFTMLLIGQFGVAGVTAILCLLALLGWHSERGGNPVSPTNPLVEHTRLRATWLRRAKPAFADHPVSWWGMLMLIASEATLFGAFVGTYYYLRFTSREWPQDGLPEPKLVVPLVLVACLVSTSIPMQLASAAARAGRVVPARLFLVAALVVQSGYFAFSANDMGDQLEHRFDITRNAYSSIYYVLLGADHAHVFVGIVFVLWLLWKLARGLTTYRVNAVQAIAWYWHAVNVLTLVVTGTLLSART